MAKRHLLSISQDYMAKKLEKAGITAVAAIVEHNTSGIISRKSINVSSPRLGWEEIRYWNDPTELAMLKLGRIWRRETWEGQKSTKQRLKLDYNDCQWRFWHCLGCLLLRGGTVSLPNLKVWRRQLMCTSCTAERLWRHETSEFDYYSPVNA